jgi:ABC-type molybdate transport system permease subunit
LLKGIADGILTRAMVLPPTVVGFFLPFSSGVHGPAAGFPDVFPL